MPTTGSVLYMRTWMIGYLLGSLGAALSPWLPPPVPVLGLLCLSLLGLLRTGSVPRLAASALAALLVSSLRGDALLADRLSERCNNQPLFVVGQVASLPRITVIGSGETRQRFEFSVDGLGPETCRGPRTLLLSYYGEDTLVPGEHRRFAVKLRRPWGLANPGSFNIQGWYTLSGIDAVGSVSGQGTRIAADGLDGRYLHHRLRQSISRAIDDAGLSASSIAVLKALTVADKSGVDHDLWRLFQQYGISHLLVISGLHVALVAALAFALGRLLGAFAQGLSTPGANWPWGEIIALVCAAAYAALAGFSVATSRALIMLTCFLVARMSGRASSGFDSLLLAAFALVLVNPLVLVGSGFWLSFGAVAGLMWLAQWQVKGGRLRAILRPHLFMAALMLPLGTAWFGGSSWVAAPANLVLIPLVGFVVVPLSLLGAGLSMLHSDAAAACWRLAALPLDVLWLPATALAAQSDLFLATSGGPAALALALLAIALLVLPLGGRRRMSCLILIVPLLLQRAPPGEQPRLHVLDVGQGTAVVFTAGDQALLYDTGGGDPAGPNIANSVILPWLRYRGISSLETFVISHDDLDHSAGAGDILRDIPVGTLLAGEHGQRGARPCRTGHAWQWPGMIRFRILAPAGTEAGNDASCVLQIQAPGMRVLLPGDIGVAQERELIRYWGEQLRSDVLLVGHHGSLTSTSQSWLNHVAPTLAVIGAGYASRFGHPHARVLQRLTDQGIAVHETAREGALTIGPELQVHGYRDGFQPWWM